MGQSEIEVVLYRRDDGFEPVTDWLASVRDKRAAARMRIRMYRLTQGLFGDVRPVGGGILELREDVGPGYRLYVARHSTALVVLLCAGSKQTQAADIQLAQVYWTEWKRSNA
ncbi:type II toxin-antitoxin system RelE/ParE family toxin [Cupriavidus plantarum]|uniref:Putative addiction module killer protein n=1 Tax=Cupriavidus plantarum TaxID=942865 RepID=A0A316EUF6_9BURK|nr:type II toxin-antitoxin system RelE/ParE family toxin [Cupriavidus plantarum]PWK36407.1 putative addiction module killer protein [Cupriavidus plantarum]RLK44295.1 putative addiction module killer protein [Cupriavidus plantarum]CAG2142379.1 hypothetical protein LMG26296_03201 [Cupriavidus plantarum]SMR65496.1 putative addiction module killer protein [Cupriavidus plantarum]